MSDFRDSYYKNYVSSFKYFISDEGEKALASNWMKLRRKVLPFISHYDKNVNILEIGCGPGHLMHSLKSEGFQNITGIDISEEQILKAKARGLNVIAGNVFDYLVNKKDKYEVIIAYDIIEHFDKRELENLFTLIHQSLKKGGSLIIHTPNGIGISAQKIIYGDITHLTIFSPNSLLQILKLCRFNEIEIIEGGPVAVDLNGLLRLIAWKIIKNLYYIIRLAETGGRDTILTEDLFCCARK